MEEKGIEHVCVPPGAHAQNSRVECVHLTLLNLVRTNLIHAGLPAVFWAEAAAYAAYVRNRAPASNGKIPDDLWRRHPVCHDHLQPFGSRLFFRDHRQIGKLAPRYSEGILMGYQKGSHNCHVWDPELKKVISTRDIRFSHVPPTLLDHIPDLTPRNDPSPSFIPLANPDLSTPAPPILEPPPPIPPPPPPSAPPSPGNESAASVPCSASPAPMGIDHQGWTYEPYPRSAAPSLEIPNTDTPQVAEGWTLRSGHSYLAEKSEHKVYALAAQVVGDPQTYREALHAGDSAEWVKAMKDELDKLDKYKVWDVVPREKNMRVMGARWVYTRKIDGETGKLAAYKARWVAKGYRQREGIDYGELFAAVAHKDSIRVFLALVNHLDLECDQVDIKSAFLNGDLDETIYLSPPEHSDIPQTHILRLRKSLYGLRQAPRCFNKAFDGWLKSQDLMPTHADPCLYVHQRGKEFLMLSVHVDDQLIACNS